MVENRRLKNIPHLHFSSPFGVTPFEFQVLTISNLTSDDQTAGLWASLFA